MRRKLNYRPMVESLEGRQLMAVLVAESEPNNTKTRADVAAIVSTDVTELSGTVSSRRDTDFFRIRSETGGTVELNVATLDGLLAKVTVETRLGRDLLNTDPRDGENSGTFTIEPGQDLIVRVRGDSKGPAGDYVISLSFEGTTPGGGGTQEPANVLVETEVNGLRALANVAALGTDGILQIQGTARNRTDQDFFVLRPTQSGQLSINLASVGEDAKLEVQTRLGRKLLEIEQNDGETTGVLDVVAGETYYLRLRSAGRLASSYLVDLALTSGVSIV